MKNIHERGINEMKKANKNIRKEIEDAGLTYWQVAEQIGITAGTFTVWLRAPLEDTRKERTIRAIDALKK